MLLAPSLFVAYPAQKIFPEIRMSRVMRTPLDAVFKTAVGAFATPNQPGSEVKDLLPAQLFLLLFHFYSFPPGGRVRILLENIVTFIVELKTKKNKPRP
jgi:hypothetical protein